MKHRLRFEPEELLAGHSVVRQDEVDGHRFHGGFDKAGRYRSPRTLWRRPAIANWTKQLKAEGGALLPVPASLFDAPQYPTVSQQALLIRHGITRPFYDALTATAEVERKAGELRGMSGPDFSQLVRAPLEERAVGHLDRGLLAAHGMDEGGDLARPDLGAHDAMWIVARDLLFDVEPIQRQRPFVTEANVVSGLLDRRFPEITLAIEFSLRFFMNVLLGEIRAELMFGFCDALLSRTDIFGDRPEARKDARQLIGRIRRDEIAHVGYLRVMLSELRAMDWHGEDGRFPGDRVIDPMWAMMVEHHRTLEVEAASARNAALLPLVAESPSLNLSDYLAAA